MTKKVLKPSMKGKEYPVCAEGVGRLDRFIKNTLPLPYGTLMRAVRKGDVRVNGQRAHWQTQLYLGDSVWVYQALCPKDKHPASITSAEAIMLEEMCVYQDAHFWVCSKPSGLAVQKGTGIKRSLEESLRGYSAQYGQFWRLVHRLDKQTSGVMVCAKSREVAQSLTLLFRQRSVTKEYVARVHGIIDVGGVMRAPLGPDKNKHAETHYRVTGYHDKTTLVRVNIATGRKHQIRQHFASIGHPVCGDSRYAPTSEGPLCLHAAKLCFAWQGKTWTWWAPPPAYVQPL